ncbi:MAG: DUF192 domain-containing protein [Acidiferrobacteraceae bacterium]|nr:DUF192 domain-containing protein [Acidiferrobacteraceae bacterium]MBT3639864.1 DUF192 domain-containing protein [Acidiferrobacteraceae bacterium]MBT3768634.1 DUF192 domain-containing protein [Acidiferrobacteraceae bacterium]MBT4403898.1 DUF192 domain-containing protein [Acidiferrobacteraceae bacterium]MBT6786085.1 DUF192 domain-containing protein [Acidiferrobacteraceae bacterium]
MPPVLAALPQVSVVIQRDGAPKQTINARLAKDATARAAGFQQVCPRQIKTMAILFVFDGPFGGVFHMRNVLGPLDILFADKAGIVLDAQTMAVYSKENVKTVYSPGTSFYYALEIAAGRLGASVQELIGARLRIKGVIPQ